MYGYAKSILTVFYCNTSIEQLDLSWLEPNKTDLVDEKYG